MPAPVPLVRIGWRNLWRQKRRTLLTLSAMSTGVVACMVTIAIADGMFADAFEAAVGADLGHVQVHAPGWPARRALHETIDDAAAALARLDALAAPRAASGRLYAYALLGVRDKAAGARLAGVDPVREAAVTFVARRVEPGGRWLDPAPGGAVVLGAGLAESLGARVGDEVVAVSQADDGTTGSALWRVAGLFRTGSVVADRSGAYVHVEDLRALVGLHGRLHEIALVAGDRRGIEALAARAREALAGRGLLVRTWREVNPLVGRIMDLQDVAMWITLGFVFLVAAFGILNTMLMSVLERTRELGMLAALGLRPAQTVAMVLWEAASLAALAALAGLGPGLLLDWWLVRHGLDLRAFIGTWSWGGIAFSPVLRAQVRPEAIAAVILGLFVITLLAALWPAVRAARLKPVDAMRQE